MPAGPVSPRMLSWGTAGSSRGACRGARHHFRVSAAVVPGFLKSPRRFPGNFFDFYAVSTEASVGRRRAVCPPHPQPPGWVLSHWQLPALPGGSIPLPAGSLPAGSGAGAAREAPG